jgi:hypothetical protein
MVQLWVNLRAKNKISPLHYQSILSSQIPSLSLPGGYGSLRVIAGEFRGLNGRHLHLRLFMDVSSPDG